MKAKYPVTLGASLLVAGGIYANGNIAGSVFNKDTSEPLDFATVAFSVLL